ncbi:MAG: Ig-like domain-containing protein [Acidobacteriota bacterium]|nr:Ig-like domain-containing protein [Acidobacteriota bacterium]
MLPRVQRPVRCGWLPIAVVALALSGAPPASAALAWHPTNVAALQAYPEFFQGRQVLVQALLSTDDSGRLLLKSDGSEIQVLDEGPPPPEGPVEVRGEFWNVGGMRPDDPRLQRADVQKALGLTPTAPWPKSGSLLAINASSINPVSPPTTATIRTIVLAPGRWVDQQVTVTGQFSGRNLLGELPDAPGRSRWDFVLRANDSALWVTGQQPKGKGFDLGLDARMDTAQWLQVTGTVQQGRGLVWIEASKDGIVAAKPPSAQPAPGGPAAAPPAPSFPAPEAIFSVPTAGQTDVPLSTTVRIQFSRDLDPKTIEGHVKVAYSQEQSRQRGEPQPPTIGFSLHYFPDRRELQVLFAQPLDRFRTVQVELLPGILGTDHQPLKPWTLTFTLGGT